MRVVAGRLGGRRLVAPRGLRTRPTADRVRQALFSLLGDVSDLSVLDLFAGTGALGIEALSRGAARAVFVESDRQAQRALTQNLEALGLTDSSRVVGQRVERAREALRPSSPFQLVFCDPPWAEVQNAALAVQQLSELMASGARLVFEHSVQNGPRLSHPLLLDEQRRWGDTAVSLFHHE